jgi:photosystem II stability/assembly factor-like uncharacterized protein
MRTTALFLSISLVLVSAPASAGVLDEISHRDKIYDIHISGDEVFVVGYPGLILHSADRGKTWERLDSGGRDALFAVDINKKGRGLIVGRTGLVLMTTDGGKTWTKRDSGAKEHLFNVDITESGKAWAVGHFGTVLHSPDGGLSWKPQEFQPEFPEGTPEVEMGVISDAEKENEGAAVEARLNAVAFADDQRGWIMGEFGMVLHTQDGGQTWKRQPSASGKLLFALHVLDENRVLAVGSEGTYMETTDGGRSWKATDTGTQQHIMGLYPSGDDLYVVGRDGLVMVRKGKAGSFKRLSAGLYTWLMTVGFFDDKSGLAAGGRGHLLQTSDAGETWQRLSGR